MRIVFMGTPDFSVPALEALAARHEVAAVYAQPPRPSGRGQKPRPGPVAARAEALGLPVRTPVTLRAPEALAEFAAFAPEVAVVAAYGLILPQAVLDVPPRGCLNIHASLLPRWRGAAPIQRAIMAGDAETGVCIMQMEAGLDTGPVLLRRATGIGPRDTAGSLHDRLAGIGAEAVTDALARLDTLAPEPQPGEGVTYAAKIDKAEARVDWSRPAAEVDRLIRGLAPFPGAWTEIAGERVKLLLSERAAGAGAPGTVLDGLTIACGEDAVRVLTVQRAGRGAMPAEAFLRGTPVSPGDASRVRLDQALVAAGHAPSRARAQALIAAGAVTVDGRVAVKSSMAVGAAAALVVDAAALPWVSRAALKLIAGLDGFGLDPCGAVALDLGASTGGFSQVLLARGAAEVWAVDVGHGQLAAELAGEPRLHLIEGLNVRELTSDHVPPPDFVVADSSFIPLGVALPPALRLARPGASLVALVKPQFEVGPARVGKGGIVRDPAAWADAVAGVRGVLLAEGWTVLGEAPSPIEGGDGNREFLVAARKT